jgi:hypothetical protein
LQFKKNRKKMKRTYIKPSLRETCVALGQLLIGSGVRSQSLDIGYGGVADDDDESMEAASRKEFSVWE